MRPPLIQKRKVCCINFPMPILVLNGIGMCFLSHPRTLLFTPRLAKLVLAKEWLNAIHAEAWGPSLALTPNATEAASLAHIASTGSVTVMNAMVAVIVTMTGAAINVGRAVVQATPVCAITAMDLTNRTAGPATAAQ